MNSNDKKLIQPINVDSLVETSNVKKTSDKIVDFKDDVIKEDITEQFFDEDGIRAIIDNEMLFRSAPIRVVGSGSISSSSSGWVLEDDGITLEDIKAGSDPSILGWQNTMTFSAVDYDTVSWTSGIISLSEGTTFNIVSGNTGNMGSRTYIYFSKLDSETVLQTSTTAADAVGTGKILVAVAQNNDDNTSDATLQVFGGTGGLLLTTENLAANTITTNELTANCITANEISTNAVTAVKINVSQLSAISANIGTITAGSITGVTITGGTFRTASSGYRVQMTSANGIRFLNGSTELGKIQADTSGDLHLFGSDDIIFNAGGGDRCGVFGSYFRPVTDGTYNLGKSDFRWADVFTSKVSLDNWTLIEDGSGRFLIQKSGVDYLRIDSSDGDLHLQSGASIVYDL